jgi:hypothetical protein
MTRFVLYGVNAESLEHARDCVESALQIGMEAREGFYNGGNYFGAVVTGARLKLRENVDLDDVEREFDGLSEPDFPHARWLLYVDCVDGAYQLLAALDALSNRFLKLRAGA